MFVRWLALLVVVGSCLCTVRAGDDFKLEKGYQLLFNGKNLDDWSPVTGKESLSGKTEAFGGRFKVTDGVLVIDPSVKGDVRIKTARGFGDVHIKFAFLPDEKCNNDLFLRGLKFDIIPKSFKAIKVNDWNELEILAKDDKAVVKINGETVRTEKLKAANSVFQIRAEFGALKIKNVRVKELKASD